MSNKQSRLRTVAIFAIAAVFGLQQSVAASADTDYYQLIYDFEVAGYCGLLTENIVRTTEVKRRALEGTTTLTEAELKKIRISAYVAADAEYQNRSLGGHKVWCETDGLGAVNRILNK